LLHQCSCCQADSVHSHTFSTCKTSQCTNPRALLCAWLLTQPVSHTGGTPTTLSTPPQLRQAANKLCRRYSVFVLFSCQQQVCVQMHTKGCQSGILVHVRTACVAQLSTRHSHHEWLEAFMLGCMQRLPRLTPEGCITDVHAKVSV